jgi:hypothetical protein
MAFAVLAVLADQALAGGRVCERSNAIVEAGSGSVSDAPCADWPSPERLYPASQRPSQMVGRPGISG